MKHERKRTTPIKEKVKEDVPALLSFFSKNSMNDYELDLYCIFKTQAQKVIYPQNQATAFTFAGVSYVNPAYSSLYKEDTVVHPRNLHPSLAQNMQHFLQKYESFLTLKRTLEAYCTRWYTFQLQAGFLPNDFVSSAFSLPSSLCLSYFGETKLRFPSWLSAHKETWYEKEKDVHSLLATIHLKNQLVGE